MGYSDATLHNVNKVLDIVGEVSMKNHREIGGPVPKAEIVRRLSKMISFSSSGAHRIVDAAAQLGLLGKSRPTDVYGDKRLTFVTLTQQGMEIYNQGAIK